MKRLTAVLLTVVLLVLLLPVTALADDWYIPMTTSQEMIDMLKTFEGFSPTPYWDYSQYTIGYGTGCGKTREEVPEEYWDGITRETGEALLREYLSGTAEAEVNKFYKSINRQPTQQQFDAMVDFTFNLGSSWMRDSRVREYIETYRDGEEDPLELVSRLGAWCRAGNEIWSGLCSRRIREAIVYLRGEYYLPWTTEDSDLPVVSDADLPYFRYLIYNGNGAALSSSGYSDTVSYYFSGSKYSSLLKPRREGYNFAGWYCDDGSLLLDSHLASRNQRVKADWVKLPFTDVSESQWYSTAVAYCYKNGYMNGKTKTTFEPNMTVDRGMMVAVLYRMAGEPAVSATVSFPDVPANEYFAPAVAWAQQVGITNGYLDGTFRPKQAITRSEMVKMLYIYAEKVAGLDVSGRRDLSRFTDESEIPQYAREYFSWAMDAGLVNGTTETTLSPVENAARRQLAKELMILDNLG